MAIPTEEGVLEEAQDADRGPLVKFLPYIVKTQLSLPRGKKIKKSESKEGRENPERRQTLPPRVGFSFPNRQYHTMLFLLLRCRNSPLLAAVFTIG